MKKMLLIVAVAFAAISCCGNKGEQKAEGCCKDSAAVCCQADSAKACCQAEEAPAAEAVEAEAAE